MNKKNIVKLIISILLCELAGGVAAIFTAPAISTWYRTLNKPSFNPPDWVFSPVWITLFLIMGVSLFLVWRKGKGIKSSVNIFGIQLTLNVLWSIIFFGIQWPVVAFIEIIFLWITILLTIIKFYKISKPAGILLFPYILWVSFAVVLNFSLWQLNK